MIVEGLNSDFYYTNNPIYLKFSQISTETRYIEYFPQGADVNPIRLYPNGRESIQVDISQLVKLAIPKLPHNTDYTTLGDIPIYSNWASVTLIIKQVTTTITGFLPTFTKIFINGGKRTYEKNQTHLFLSQSGINKIPQWGGYPIDYWRFSNRQLVKNNVIPDEIKDLRKIKGCNPVYVKYKNSGIGYSYWLFENSESVANNRNLGVVEKVDYFLDLGNSVEEGVTVTSKVPKKYIGMMFDLIDSNEIYIFLGNNKWEQVISDNNSVKHNPFNENEKVKIKFKKVHRYNPSLIW